MPFSRFLSVKTENYPSYVGSIHCFNVCTRTQNGLPCDIARWSTLLNMHWTARYFHPCSLKHENHCLDTFYFCWVYMTQTVNAIWTASSEFGTYRLCEQRRFRRACAFAQSRQNLRCSLIQAVNQEELSDRKPDPWPLWMAGHAQLKFVMTECSKT